MQAMCKLVGLSSMSNKANILRSQMLSGTSMLRDHVCMCAEPVEATESSRPVPIVAPLKRMQAICKLLSLSCASYRECTPLHHEMH